MLEFLGNINTIVTILCSLTTGGIISTIISYKYLRHREEARTKQEIENAESLELNNTRDLIKLYKEALIDQKELNTQTEQKYIKKLEEYSSQLNDCISKLDECKKTIKDQEVTIETLTKNQLKLKLEVQNLHSQSMNNCNECSFKATCDKYKALKLRNNE